MTRLRFPARTDDTCQVPLADVLFFLCESHNRSRTFFFSLQVASQSDIMKPQLLRHIHHVSQKQNPNIPHWEALMPQFTRLIDVLHSSGFPGREFNRSSRPTPSKGFPPLHDNQILSRSVSRRDRHDVGRAASMKVPLQVPFTTQHKPAHLITSDSGDIALGCAINTHAKLQPSPVYASDTGRMNLQKM